MSSPVLPIALRAAHGHALLIGGGDAALRKTQSLVAGGFRPVVVAPRVDSRLRAIVADANGTIRERSYERADLDGAAVVVAATDDDAVNATVVADARAAKLLACDAMHPERGDFTMMATTRIGDLTLALDSGGSSPSFSRRMLDEIAVQFGAEYAAAARTLARIRREIRTRLPRDERVTLLRRLSALPVRVLATERRRLICASRASALATAQTRGIAAALAQRGIATEILTVTTAGDRDRERPLHAFGEANVFVKEIEHALREGRADYAVHSAKDLPSELAPDMTLAAFSARADARDAFCSQRYASFDALPPGAVVGTSSLRRREQLRALRPDLRYDDLRGNVDTRLRALRDGRYDAIVLAVAGLQRLGAAATHTVPFAADMLVPAAGQGALAVEVRAEDALLAYELGAALNDPQTERCVRCERAALRALRAGCSAPVGVHAVADGSRMRALLSYATDDGVVVERAEAHADTVSAAEALGAELARRAIARLGLAEVEA